MATYFHGNADIGAGDGLHTLILMNPAYVGYSDSPPQQPPPNLLLFNSNSVGNTASAFHHPPPSQTQHFVGIPLHGGAANSASPQDPSPQHQDVPPPGFMPRLHYNLYNLPIDMGTAAAAAARDAATRSQQGGLSLSLSSQQHHGYVSFRSERDIPSQPLPTTGASTAGAAVSSPRATEDVVRPIGGSPSSASAVSNGAVNGVQSVLLNSKYLKAAQEILDEVVNVGKEAKITPESSKPSAKIEQPKNSTGAPAATTEGTDTDGSAKRGSGELTTAERQEIQMKKAKLVNMLDEVEQRYRQYHHQMHIVITWFEQAAGIGSAKTYTALALKTISKQFRCLKDAILGQIRAANKTLGEDDALDGKMEGSRLKYVDNQIRQQRALQQLGMIQHNAWRPQRGLPERSVSVLRAWLFEHFLHPYPKDSDKVMLAKQTGLTRSQVSNWFINARVRLWKPMVEEMYTEEMKENDKNNNNGSDGKTRTTKIEDNLAAATSPTKDPNLNPSLTKQDSLVNPNNSNNITSTSPTGTELQSTSSFILIRSSEIEGLTQGSPKKLRHIDMLHSPPVENDPIPMKFDSEGRQGRDEFTLMGAPTNFIGGFGSYPIADLGRFGGAEQFHAPYSGNGTVSLTLGLPHCENMSISATHQTFLPNQTMQLGRGVKLGETNDFNPMSAGTNLNNMYDNIDMERRKRLVAAAQLLPDFVA